MSDIPSSGASTPVQPVSSSAQTRTAFGSARDGSLENLPKSLLSNPRDLTLRGEVVGRNEDGSTRIQTPRGAVNVRLSGEALARGQRVEVEIPAGSPPANARVRAETQAPQTQAQTQTRQEQTAQAQGDQAKSSPQAEQSPPARSAPQPNPPSSSSQVAPEQTVRSQTPPPVPSAPPQTQTTAPQSTVQQGGNVTQGQPIQAQAAQGQAAQQGIAQGQSYIPPLPPSGLPPSGLPTIGGQAVTGAPAPLQVGQYVQLFPVQGALQPFVGATVEAAIQGQQLQALPANIGSVPFGGALIGSAPSGGLPAGTVLSVAQPARGAEGSVQSLQNLLPDLLPAGFGVVTAGAALGGASFATSLGANGVVDGLIRAFLTFGATGGATAAMTSGAQTQGQAQIFGQTQTQASGGAAMQGGGVMNSATLAAGGVGVDGVPMSAGLSATGLSINGLSVTGGDFETLNGSQGVIRVAGAAVMLDARVVDIMRPSVLTGGVGSGTASGVSSGAFSGANTQPGQITGIIGAMVQGDGHTGARMSVSLFDGGRPLAGQFLLPAGVQSLPEGTELRLDVVQAQAVGAQGRAVGAPMAGLSGLYQALGLMDSGWGDMAEFLNIVAAKLPPVDAQAAMRIMPQIGGGGIARFTTPVLFFLAALRGGDMSTWMGERNNALLRGDGRGDLVGRLERGFSALGKSFREPVPVPGGELRSVSLPLLFGPDLSRLQFHVRDYHGDDDNENDGDDRPDRRIVIDFSLSRMGDMQIDSLLIGQRMETILRTQTPFSEAMRQDLRKRYADVMRGIGYQGHLDFSAGEAAQ